MADDQSTQNPQGSQAQPAGTDGDTQPQTPTIGDEIKKQVQAAEDRVRTHYSQELKKQQAVIDELRSKTMTESEVRKLRESQLAEKEAVVRQKELDLLAVDLLKDLNISPALRELIRGKDEDETKTRAGALKTEFQKAVETAVQERFKQAGRDPKKSEESPKQGRTYTKAEAEELSRKVQSPATPQKERESIMAELQAAMREGRIR